MPARSTLKTSAGLAIFSAALVFSFACSRTGVAAPLGTAPCRMGTLQAECRTVEVFENRATRSGRKLALKVVVIRSHSGSPRPDPLFGIAGGPGMGLTATAEFVAQIFDWARSERDLVLVDSRGTGDSHPLNCSAAPGGTLQSRFEPLVVTAKRCLPELSANADLTQYNAETIADDLDDVRAALGYEKINIQAISYGTRVAQVYARRHGEHLRSMLLEGVCPVSEHLPLGMARNSQRVLGEIVRLCDEDKDCHQHYPNLRDELRRVQQRLQQGPVPVRLTNPATNQEEAVQLDHAMAAQGVRFMLYDVGEANRVPKVIHAAATGDWRSLAEIALRHTINGQNFAFGMWLSATCTEDVQRIRDDQVTPDSAGTFFGDFRMRDQRAACAVWPKGTLSADFGTAVRSDVPALLAAGSLDPQTPPQWAREVAAAMPNARVLEMPGYGHLLVGMIGDGCLDQVEQQLLKQGSAQNVDLNCTGNVRRPPFAY
jgi:pimeloyl-ACP methyl ester carboxylesterase